MNFRRHFCVLAAVAAVFTAGMSPGQAETRVVRIAKQFGISYLPLTIMEQKKLLEAEGKKQGLDLSTEWLKFTGGPPMNEALVSGNLDFASGGVGPLVTVWARTQKKRSRCASWPPAMAPARSPRTRRSIARAAICRPT